MDCGSTCLRIICKHYGRSFSAAHLRDLCHTSQEGVSMLAISDAAESLGFRTAGVRLTWDQLCKEATMPCIVYWKQVHFVVVYRIRKGMVYVSDPAQGLLAYPEADFKKCWLSSRDEEGTRNGIALLLEPGPEFFREEDDKDKQKVSFRYLLSYLRPYKSYIVQLLLAMLVGSMLSLIMPFISQNIVDVGIGTSNLSFVVVMLVAQLLLVLGQAANDLIRSWLMLHMTTRVSISLISDFLAKLMRLPIAFFDSRKVGDIMQRPPLYSACMVAGDRAYELARKGADVELAAKPIHIDEIELTDFDASKMQMSIRVVCGKGTYIRSLARDIGQALGSGAFLTALCRTRVGDVRLDQCLSFDEFPQWLEEQLKENS